MTKKHRFHIPAIILFVLIICHSGAAAAQAFSPKDEAGAGSPHVFAADAENVDAHSDVCIGDLQSGDVNRDCIGPRDSADIAEAPDAVDPADIADAPDGDYILAAAGDWDEEKGDYSDINDDIDDDGPVDETYADQDPSQLKLPNPKYYVENIHISGNKHTSRERILKIMQIADDPDSPDKFLTTDQLEDCRIRLAVSGLFENVEMKLMPGSQTGRLRIEIAVDERSPIQINRYFVGTDSKSPYWHGLDVSWIGAFSSPHRMRMTYAATTASDYTLDLHYFVPSIAKLPISLMAGIHTMNGHEGVFGPAFKAVRSPENDNVHLDDMSFERHGASLGMGFAVSDNFRLHLRTAYGRLRRQNRDKALESGLDVYLKRDWSNLFNGSLTLAFDTRSGHEMPNDGHAAAFSVGGTFKTKASQYEYIKLMFMHQSNVRLGSPSHILRISTFLGGVWGDAPFFEKFFYNDFYDLAPSRIGLLNPSERGAFDIFKTGAKGLAYEDYLAHLSVSYAWQPIPQRIEFFGLVSAVWANSAHNRQIRIANKSYVNRSPFPVDLSFNAGVRLRTDYGLFSFTLAHIFNLIPR